MTKLYKHYKTASKQGRVDAADLDGASGFMLVSDMVIVEDIENRAFSWTTNQKRTMRLVKTAGGKFGFTACELSRKSGGLYGTVDYCQTLYSNLATAKAHFDTRCTGCADAAIGASVWREVQA